MTSTEVAEAGDIHEDLTGSARKGLRWSMASGGLARLGTFASGILLARLIAPSEYGEFTVALVALVLLVNLNDLGMEVALVRWQGSVARVAPTATTVILGNSLVMFGIFVLAAQPFANALGAPAAGPMIRLMSLSVVINGLFAVPSAMLTRSFRQDRRTLAQLLGFFAGMGVTIWLALLGMGAWSLAWGRLVTSFVVGLLHLLTTPTRFKPGWDQGAVAQLMRSGLPIAGATIVAVAMLNVDYIVIGAVLGSTELGLYQMAFNLSNWPVMFFSVAVARVSVPLFARLQQSPEDLDNAFRRALTMMLLVTLPVCLVLGVLASPLIHVVYGEQWLPSAAPLHLLAGLGLLRVICQLVADLLVAADRGRTWMYLNLTWIVLLVPSLWIGARWGLVGVGVAHVSVATFVITPLFVRALGAHVDLRAVFRSASQPVLSALVAVGVSVPIVESIRNPIIALGVGTSVILLTMVIGTGSARREVGWELSPLLRRVAAGRNQGASTS